MKRPLWMVVGALLGAAVALWAASRLAWTTKVVRHPGTDVTTVVDRAGGDSRPLVPLALLALAGVAAAVATGGWPRRIVGVLLAVAGAGAIALAVPGGTDFFPWGRILAVAGGLLMIAASVLLVRFSGQMPRMGAAYQRTNTERSTDDSDHEMWRALSVGKDPTTDDR
jgi:hypothetical protein